MIIIICRVLFTRIFDFVVSLISARLKLANHRKIGAAQAVRPPSVLDHRQLEGVTIKWHIEVGVQRPAHALDDEQIDAMDADQIGQL